MKETSGETSGNLSAVAIKGVRWTSISSVIVTALQFIQLAVLSRLLLPADFGLIAIVHVVIGFSRAFMDMGVSNAIIHRKEVSQSQLSSLYWLNIVVGLLLTVVMALMTPVISNFYANEALEGPLYFLSLTFVIASFGSQFQVLFQKELQFIRMAKIEMAAAFIGTVVSILIASHGYGVYALVWSGITATMVTSLFFLSYGLLSEYRPQFIYRHGEIKSFFSFGFYQMGERTINFLSANSDKIIIGKMLGMQEVGFYSLAWQLAILPLIKINPIVNKVAFPVYATVQNDVLMINKYYRYSLKVLGLVTIPILSFILFFSHNIVLFLFGEGWGKSADVLEFLVLIAIFKTMGNPSGSLLLAKGLVRVGFWFNVCWATLVVVVVYLGLIIKPDIVSAAMAILLASVLTSFIYHTIIARTCNIKYGPILKDVLKIIMASFSIGFIAKYIAGITGGGNIDILLVGGGVSLGLYLTYLYFNERSLIKKVLSRK